VASTHLKEFLDFLSGHLQTVERNGLRYVLKVVLELIELLREKEKRYLSNFITVAFNLMPRDEASALMIISALFDKFSEKQVLEGCVTCVKANPGTRASLFLEIGNQLLISGQVSPQTLTKYIPFMRKCLNGTIEQHAISFGNLLTSIESRLIHESDKLEYTNLVNTKGDIIEMITSDDWKTRNEGLTMINANFAKWNERIAKDLSIVIPSLCECIEQGEKVLALSAILCVLQIVKALDYHEYIEEILAAILTKISWRSAEICFNELLKGRTTEKNLEYLATVVVTADNLGRERITDQLIRIQAKTSDYAGLLRVWIVLVRDHNAVVRRTAERWISEISTKIGTFIAFVNDTFPNVDDLITLLDAVANHDPNGTATSRSVL
jgi:hypothetical protein